MQQGRSGEAALAAARAEAMTVLEAERIELAGARVDLDHEFTNLRSEAAKLLARAQAKEEALEIQRTRAAELQRQINAMSTELEDRNETIAKLRAEVVQQRFEQEDLRSRFDRDRAEFEAARHELEVRAASHENRWAMEVDRARETTKAVSARLAQLESVGTTNS
jgi:chromosome segregation ATPase